MKLLKQSALALALAALVLPTTVRAQESEEKEKKKTKSEQIIITRKDGKEEKMTIVVDGDKVTVNGKPIEDLKDADITVKKLKAGDVYMTMGDNFRGFGNFDAYAGDIEGLINMNRNANKAMLGVTSEKGDKGARIKSITKESGAEKAGLKEGDIISRIDQATITSPDDLSNAIKDHNPGDKVTVWYLRDGKEQKATAELTKWRGISSMSISPEFNMDFDFEGIPTPPTPPRAPGARGQSRTFTWNSERRPKLGISVQDTEDGKGVKVTDVDDESNAQKAGIEKDDIILEVDGKEVNSTDEITTVLKANSAKATYPVKVSRKGKTRTIEVKVPKKLKTADL